MRFGKGYVCAVGASLSASAEAGLEELAAGSPAFGGGASGVLFRGGAKSCSLLFCSLSAKYSSNARLGEAPACRFLRPDFADDRVGAGAPKVVGGEAIFAGTRKLPVSGGGSDPFGTGSFCCSYPSSRVSKTTSPGPSTSSPRPTGNLCSAP
jgi:hypothetical protein